MSSAPVHGEYKVAFGTLADTGNMVAAVASKRIAVHGLKISTTDAVTATVRSGTTAIDSPTRFAGDGGGWFLDLSKDAYFITTAGEALALLLSTTVTVYYTVWYREV